ncbi:hypothetical protein FACS18942_02360 [Planctomycetales bacterium]|nr:hypothetical protein FACS18942_02360 [Planctomycetales bacterium]GHT36182.1 hypothetical protein FACS189427_07310 [Planctomycetales bacterium]
MARWQDGSSNQFITGEKHIPVSQLGVCEYSGTGNVWKAFDCSYLIAGDGMNCMSAYRPMVWHYSGDANPENNGSYIWGLWRMNDELSDADHLWSKRTPAASFGSWHSGVCQFVLGDGSVRAVSVTVANPVLYSMSCVRDGLSVAQP